MKSADGGPKGLAEASAAVGGALAGAALAFFLVRQFVHPQPMPDSMAAILWYGVRGAGVCAFLVLWLTTAAGICVTGRFQTRWLPTGAILFIHQLGDLALSLAALHAILLLGDRFAGFSPSTIVVPFRASYRPLWTGLGILALYLLAAVQWSINLRPRLGYVAWRTIHFASFAVFGLALVHGLASGTDSPSLPMRLMYALTGASVALLIVLRALRQWSAPQRAAGS